MSNPYKEISSALGELLIGRKFLIEPSPKDTSPLFLLLTLRTDKVGFATLHDEPRKSYEEAFEKFRELYSIHSSEWADFDLTLVICRVGTGKVRDEFCNEIETDPYFCRKFVIDLSKDLRVEIGRLPFIPLCPDIVGLKRPSSAQTFLMKHGLKPVLARYLVVPHARGRERIVGECIKGVLGRPEWLKAKREDFLPLEYEVRPKLRLKEIEINNFRAYRESRKFDLDADLVVLFGPNGFGKTSFFDAIDFVCTGGVGRFEERFGRKIDRLLNTLKYLDSSINDSFIKATILLGGEEVAVERYLKNRWQAYINGNYKNRTQTLMLLTGLAEKPPDLRIENFVRLFRATHVFAQEYQTLTPKEFREQSKLPQDTVSRMLAFQDYVEGINKSREVSEELKRQGKRKESEINLLKNSLKSKKIEREQLSQSAKIVEKPEILSVMTKQITEKIISEINIPIEIPKRFTRKIGQDWRTKIAVKKSSLTQKLEAIERLEEKFHKLGIQRNRLREKSLQLTGKEKLLGELNKDYSKKETELEENNEKLKKMILERRNLSSKKENLSWFLQIKLEYEKLKEQSAKENEIYRNLQTKLFELVPKIEKLKSENEIEKEAIVEIAAEIKTLESTLKRLGSFEKSVDGWLKALNQEKKIKAYLEMIEQELVNAKNQLRVKKSELNAAIITQDKLNKRLDSLQRSQSDLQTLLDNIERHIFNNICPVCGTSHKSKEELVEKLRIQRGIQPKEIQELLKLFEDAKGRTEESKKDVNDLESKIELLGQKVAEAQKERLDIERIIRISEEEAITLDIPITSEDLVAVIDSKKKNISERIHVKQQKLFDQKSKAKTQGEKLATLVKQQRGLEQNLQSTESKQSRLRSMIGKINGDALNRGVSLDHKKEEIERSLVTTGTLIEDLRKQIEIQQTENQNCQKIVNSLSGKKNCLEREIKELDKEIVDSKRYIKEVEALIRGLNLKLDVDIDQVLVLKKDFMEELSRLDSIRNEIANLEVALDAVQISGVLAKLQRDIENIEDQCKIIEKELSQLNDWRSYFDVIHKELESLQNRALKEYTRKYGPLASIIQRRLRSVHGFGDIRLFPEKGGIAVRVEREGENNIFPSDYFSESQIQVVMLSLFLSAALTQTWSSFGPILLDDPVEHFDDLNAYSLFDLIKGLITESGKEHQFIISTCEERLFRLMRQKFSKLNGKVIFYVFESIGDKGPRVRRI